jgi:hypothetical protein
MPPRLTMGAGFGSMWDMGQFSDLVMKVANELGIGDHVSVTEFPETLDPLATISYSPKQQVRCRIPSRCFLEPDLKQVKILLAELARKASEYNSHTPERQEKPLS